MQTNKPTPDRKGMSLVLRVIITGVVLIMIAMTVIFMGTQGLDRVGGQMDDLSSEQEVITRCKAQIDTVCRSNPTATNVDLTGSAGDKYDTYGYQWTRDFNNDGDTETCSNYVGFDYYNCNSGQYYD